MLAYLANRFDNRFEKFAQTFTRLTNCTLLKELARKLYDLSRWESLYWNPVNCMLTSRLYQSLASQLHACCEDSLYFYDEKASLYFFVLSIRLIRRWARCTSNRCEYASFIYFLWIVKARILLKNLKNVYDDHV